MILTWMAATAARTALFGIAAATIERVGAGTIRARRALWFVAILCSIGSPGIMHSRLVAALRGEHAVGAGNAPATIAASTSPTVPTSIDAGEQMVDTALLAAWAALSLAAAVLFTAAHRRLRASSHELEMVELSGERVYLSDELGPAVIGIVAPRIVIPSWALTLPDDEQRLIVAHEVEHLRARDPLLAFVGLLAAVAMPWNLALWWQLARLRLAIEADCDGRVVRQSGAAGATAYAAVLLHVGERAQQSRVALLALAHPRSALAARIDFLLVRHPASRIRRFALATAAAGCVGSAAFVPGPQALDVSRIFARRVASTGVRSAVPAIASNPSVVVLPSATPRAKGDPLTRRQRTEVADTSLQILAGLRGLPLPPARILAANPTPAWAPAELSNTSRPRSFGFARGGGPLGGQRVGGGGGRVGGAASFGGRGRSAGNPAATGDTLVLRSLESSVRGILRARGRSPFLQLPPSDSARNPARDSARVPHPKP